jgi:hypothetical protein
VTYGWRKNGQPLNDAGTLSGSHTPVLSIDPVSALDSGSFDVIVADSCGTATSQSTVVSISGPPPAPLVSAPLTAPPNQAGLPASVFPAFLHRYLWALSAGTLDAGQRHPTITWTSPGPGTTVRIYASDLTPEGCLSDNGVATVQIDFSDVPPSNPFHDFIDALALHFVTIGCGDGHYCPDSTITRAQMAALLARAHDGDDLQIPIAGFVNGSSYDCEAGFGHSYFHDVGPGDLFCRHIHRIAALGITLGCDHTPDFCPSGLVTREQMALFIGRAIAPAATPPSAYSDGGTGRSYDCSVASPFSDVPANTASCNAVGYIWARGIVDGFGNGAFGPQIVLTRAPAAKFIANAFGLTLGP